MLAATYPLLDVFWTLLMFFAFIVWIWILFTVLADVFRRNDISGWAKVGWIVFVVLFPYLGVFVYLIAEHRGMSTRSAERAQAAQTELASYVKSVAGQHSPAEEIATAKELLDNGTIDAEEFEKIKLHALAA